MNEIDSKMLKAVREGTHFRLDNTHVDAAPDGGIEREVRLHGNLIAFRRPDGSWRMSFNGFPTRTAKDRLNALLSDIPGGNKRGWFSLERGQPFFAGAELTATEWVSIIPDNFGI